MTQKIIHILVRVIPIYVYVSRIESDTHHNLKTPWTKGIGVRTEIHAIWTEVLVLARKNAVSKLSRIVQQLSR